MIDYLVLSDLHRTLLGSCAVIYPAMQPLEVNCPSSIKSASKQMRSIVQSHALVLCQLEMRLQGYLLHQSYLRNLVFSCYLGLLMSPIPEDNAARSHQLIR